MHSSICKDPKHFSIAFNNSIATHFVNTAMVLGQPAGFSKEACLYMGADWLSSSVCHRVVRGQLPPLLISLNAISGNIILINVIITILIKEKM